MSLFFFYLSLKVDKNKYRFCNYIDICLRYEVSVLDMIWHDMMSISLHYEIGINIYTKIDIAYPVFPIDFLNF